MKRKRGKCRYCGRSYALTKAGRVRSHKMRSCDSICGGSGQVPS